MEHDRDLNLASRSAERLAALAALDILDSPAEKEFDVVTETAARLLNCPMALVSLIDTDRQWFKSHYGLEVSETPLEHSFCKIPVSQNSPLVVEDARSNPTFRGNPLVTGEPHIRFYAGVPIKLAMEDGEEPIPLGALCVVDNEAKAASPDTLKVLWNLAKIVEKLLDVRLGAVKARKQAWDWAQALAARDRLHRQLHQAEKMANIGSWRLTLDDNQVEWSDQVYAIHALPPGGPIPVETALDFFPPSDRKLLTDAVERAAKTGTAYDLEIDFINARGEQRRVRAIGELELFEGKPVALIGVFQDITDRYLMEQALRRAADTDTLTHIASRGRFNVKIEECISEVRKAKSGMALVLIDLDHFKAVNDTFGHAAGDRVLRHAAVKLQSNWLMGSFAARLGGDEFVVLLTEPDLLADLPRTIRQLLFDLRQTVYRDEVHKAGGGKPIEVSATMGVALLDEEEPTGKSLLRRADAALYKAKNHQRGTASVSGSEEFLT